MTKKEINKFFKKLRSEGSFVYECMGWLMVKDMWKHQDEKGKRWYVAFAKDINGGWAESYAPPKYFDDLTVKHFILLQELIDGNNLSEYLKVDTEFANKSVPDIFHFHFIESADWHIFVRTYEHAKREFEKRGMI